MITDSITEVAALLLNQPFTSLNLPLSVCYNIKGTLPISVLGQNLGVEQAP